MLAVTHSRFTPRLILDRRGMYFGTTCNDDLQNVMYSSSIPDMPVLGPSSES